MSHSSEREDSRRDIPRDCDKGTESLALRDILSPEEITRLISDCNIADDQLSGLTDAVMRASDFSQSVCETLEKSARLIIDDSHYMSRMPDLSHEFVRADNVRVEIAAVASPHQS